MTEPTPGKSHIMVGLFRNISIFPRIFLVILFVSIYPMVFLSRYYVQHYEAALSNNTQMYLTLLTSNLAGEIDFSLSEYEAVSRGFYTQDSMLSLLKNNQEIALNDPNYLYNPTYLAQKKVVSNTLLTLASTDTNIINLAVITPHDQYTMRVDPMSSYGALVQDLDYFRRSDYYLEAIEKSGYPLWVDSTQDTQLIHKFHYSPHGINNTFTLTTALYRYPEKEFLGVLMCNVDGNLFSTMVPNYSFSGAGNTFLMTEQGVLDSLNLDIHAPNTTSVEGLFQRMEGQSQGEFTHSQGDSHTFVVFHPSQKLPIYVTHLVDMDELLAPTQEIRQQSWVLLCGLVLVCLLLAHLTSRSISVPLRGLISNMSQFGKELPPIHSSVSGRDELTIVGEHFNQMAEDTQRLLDEIVTAKIREKDLELSRVTAQLNALQMQINPHFMYNTLDIIRWNTIRMAGGENDASKMIDKFCKLMRMSIKKDEDFVSTAQELAHIRAYLDVVNLAGREIQLVTQVDFDQQFHKIPKLSLQPLVENSVVHGFRKNSKSPTITIRGYKLQDHLLITITDNGKGMSEAQLEELRRIFSDTTNFQDSIGLRNVNQRFNLCFGDHFGVSVESVPDFGTEITLKLPLNQETQPKLL